MFTDMIARGWENFTERPSGPMNLRFIIQPALASLLAIRAGWKDARAGRPAFLWEAFTNSAARRELLRSGWKDMGKAFVMAAILDAVYQVIVHRRISVIGMLFTATLLALVPYTVLRGPANRIARLFIRSRGADRSG
jgi:lauroyl/myristoyl acyltransferase